MKKNICDKCNKMVVMHAMQTKNCMICKKEFLASCIPGESICYDCEKEYQNICKFCGKEIVEDK